MATMDPIALTRDLIRFDTINPPGQELDCITMLEQVLQRSGFTTKLHTFQPGRANLIAVLGDDPAQPGLSFTGHVDTVPLGAAPWQHDPFGGEIVGDLLYGRGASDMKGGVAAFVAASVQQAERYSGRGRLTLVITAGEETGCEGASALASSHRFLNEDVLVVAEPTANVPMIGHKGVAWFKCSLKGLTAHGSMPHEGINAAYRAADLISKLRDLKLGAKHQHLGPPTLNVGSVHAGLNINSVPDNAEIAIDCRTVPGIDHTRLRDTLGAELEDGDVLETLLALESVWTDPSSPWVKHVCAIVDDVTGAGLGWQTASYFTDAAVLAPAMKHPATLVLGPGEPAMAHKTDEYCSIERIRSATEIYRRLISDWFVR